MAQGDRRRARVWAQAKDAAHEVPRWLAWRWLFAQEYNAHQPQSEGQQEGKLRAGRVAAVIVEAMGGALMAPAPLGLTGDEAWQSWLTAARELEPDQRRSLMRVLLDQHIAEHEVPRPDELALQRKAHQLSLLLGDMAVQERARAAGWRPGKPQTPHKGSTRRRKG